MNQSQDRRSAMQRLAAGAAAAGASVMALAARAGAVPDVDSERKKRRSPRQIFKGTLRDITYTPGGGDNSDRYIITGRGDGGTMNDRRMDQKVRMTDSGILHYLTNPSTRKPASGMAPAPSGPGPSTHGTANSSIPSTGSSPTANRRPGSTWLGRAARARCAT
ncbi:MAG: hypothetical protein ACR2J8_06310 [Thermomicrobiales bacterium]